MTTAQYDFPPAIEKIYAVYDANGKSINFYSDKNTRKLWLDVMPDVPLTVFGTPNKARSNLSDVISELDEDDEDVLWQFIRANCAKQARDDSWKDELTEAQEMVNERRQYRNRDTALDTNSMRFRDRMGRLIDNPVNEEGLKADIGRYMATEDL